MASGHQITARSAFLSLQKVSQSVGTIPPEERQREEVWEFFQDQIHRKVGVSFHFQASYLIDIGAVKNSEIRIEKDYLKHLKKQTWNRCWQIYFN